MKNECPECKGSGMSIYVHPRVNLYQMQRCDICRFYKSDNDAVENALRIVKKYQELKAETDNA